MNKHKISPAEERELLQMQCELARLKIITAQKRLKRQSYQHPNSLTWQTVLLTALTAWSHQPSTWRTAIRPKRKAYRTFLFAAWLLERLMKYKSSN